MSTAIQLRRGTTSQHSTFTGAVAEATVDTTKDTLVVHDGTTVGGVPLAREDGANVSGTWDIDISGNAATVTNGVYTSSTQTLTNKTISVDNNTVSGVAASSFVLSNSSGNIDGSAAQKAIPSGAVVGTTDTQTLTNKTIQGGALTSSTAVTASGTSVDFTGIPSWVKRVTVVFRGVSTNGTSIPVVRLGTSGGFVTSGYASTVANPAGSTATSTTGFEITTSHSASDTISGNFTLCSLGSNAWVQTGVFNLGSPMRLCAGDVELASALTQIRITTVGGANTFDAGTINILYEG